MPRRATDGFWLRLGCSLHKPGALGATVGELAAEGYGRQPDTVQFATMISSIAAAIAGGDANEIHLAGQAGANAAANNYLSHDQWANLAHELAACQQNACTPAEERALQARYQQISSSQDQAMLAACESGSPHCVALLKEALKGAATQKELVLSGKLPDYYWGGSDLSGTAKLLASPQFKGATSEQAFEMASKLGGIVLDFTPGVGDLKAFLEADSPFDYALAALGAVPVLGDGAAKILREAKAAAEAGTPSTALDKLAQTEVRLAATAGETGTIWDSIRSAGPAYPGSSHS